LTADMTVDRRVGALVLCVEDAEYDRRIVIDALNEHERTGSEGGYHDVRGTRLMTLNGRLRFDVV
jgi:hypothetical protein